MNDWSGPLTPADLDRISEETKREQQRVLTEDIPRVIAEMFTKIFGPGWMAVEAIAEHYAADVAKAQAEVSSRVEAANADYAAARAAGFPDVWPPVRH